MERIIKIDETTEIKLSNNIGWLMEYQSQFGHDIVPDLMPALGAILELVEGMSERGMQLEDAKSVVKGIQGGAASMAVVELSGLRAVDLIHIIWAMAKTADDSIDPPRQWVRQFDRFPLDVILPDAFALVAEGCMSSKNWARLRTAVGSLRAEEAKKSN